MKTRIITLAVKEETDKKLRNMATMMYGKRKGALSRTVEEAIHTLAIKREKNSVSQALQLLKGGIKMKRWKFNRDELHER